MARTKIQTTDLSSNLATTIAQGGGPKIANVQIANSSWSALDDTAVSLDGGYILINGSGFSNGALVLINNVSVTSVAVVNSSIIRAEVPSANAGTYVAYVVNPDGGTAIGVNALTYSATPTWVTGSTLTEQIKDVEISIQLEATDATSYALADGSSLPANTTLASNGLFSGTVTGIEVDTTYSFTVVATDDENQDSPRTFSVTVTIVVADEYFNSTVLLLQADDTSNTSQNYTFTDSSDNNFVITRYGNATQGTFTPFSPTGWSASFDGNGDYLTYPNSSAFTFGTGPFTMEFWINAPLAGDRFILGGRTAVGTMHVTLGGYESANGVLRYVGSSTIVSNNVITDGTWHHCAIVRDNSSNINLYVDGQVVGSGTDTTNYTSITGEWIIGKNDSGSSNYLPGYLSNFRVVKGTAIYTSSFTPPTSKLTAVANTALLALQSNRFEDGVSNFGDVKITSFSPFVPQDPYDSNSHSGSVYLDGNGDYLSVASGTGGTNFGSNNFTIEFWVYNENAPSTQWNPLVTMGANGSGREIRVGQNINGAGYGFLIPGNSSGDRYFSYGTLPLKQWHHLALVRNGSNVTFYRNGANVGGVTDASFNFAQTGPLLVGGTVYPTDGVFTGGYFSNLRVLNGTAAYTSNFTPPTQPVTKTSNTSVLLNFDNAGIYDATAKNVLETVGNAQVRTNVKKYGTGSMYFDGTGDYITTAGAGDLRAFGAGNFTIELWVNFNVVNTQQVILDFRASPTDTGGSLYLTSAGRINWYVQQADRIVGDVVTASTWYHVALCRSSTSTKLFINGVQSGSTYSDSFDYICASGRPYIGALSDGTGTLYLNGYVDDLRITKGVARYTSNFTPPDKAFPIQ